MISTKKFAKVLRNTLSNIESSVPFMARRRSMVVPYVLGGIGVALVSAVAATMYFSPRTRNRALATAKDTYGKINTRIAHLTHKNETPISNGLSSEFASSGYTSTGL